MGLMWIEKPSKLAAKEVVCFVSSLYGATWRGDVVR